MSTRRSRTPYLRRAATTSTVLLAATALTIGSLTSTATPSAATTLPTSTVSTLSNASSTANSTAPAQTAAPHNGSYSGPGSKDVAGGAVFDATVGTASTETVDYPPFDSWSQIEGQSWLLVPHVGQGARLEYSVPIVPNIIGASLSDCASGSYTAHWVKLAQNLVAFGLADTVVRPGWEFNGGWYKWSAQSNPAGYAACFRSVVTSMRSIAGQHFSFDWNVNAGLLNNFYPETAWPGDAYVDYVGVDSYDTSYTHYFPNVATTAKDYAAAINDIINGNHGLKFWATFAASRGKQLALTEWGLTWLSSGHGGNDDPAYVAAMFRFMRDPANVVAYHHYMNQAGTTSDHQLAPTTRFAAALAQYQVCLNAVC